MTVGTKSVLFGAHAFWLHPWFVAAAWWKLYGVPFDPRLWLAFAIHDLGYFGKPNMDGPEGERHVEWGAWVMGALFGKRWHDLTLYHSRFYAKQHGVQPSRLCIADKLAITLTPAWLYLPMTIATGEIREYMSLAHHRSEAGEPKYPAELIRSSVRSQWYADVQEYCRRWVVEHRDGRVDTWTPDMRKARTDSGVWE